VGFGGEGEEDTTLEKPSCVEKLRTSRVLEQLGRSLMEGDNDPKYKSMKNQLILMSKTPEDRDKL